MQNAVLTPSMLYPGPLKSSTRNAVRRGLRHIRRPKKPQSVAVADLLRETVNPEKKQATAVKNLRYVLLKNQNDLSDNQKAQLQFLTKTNPRLYRAYLLKEGLRLALKAGPDEITSAVTKWMAWVQRCRIPAFRELRLKIKRHFGAIVVAAKYGISNARVEATNNKIKLLIRTAYGFRNTDSWSP